MKRIKFRASSIALSVIVITLGILLIWNPGGRPDLSSATGYAAATKTPKTAPKTAPKTVPQAPAAGKSSTDKKPTPAVPKPMPGTKTYNVKDFGAKGDGKTNDTTAIQKALDAGSKLKGGVFFPKGVYLVDPTQSLTVKSNTMVKGDGKKSVIKASGTTFAANLIILSGSEIQVTQMALDGSLAVNRIALVNSGSSNVKIDNSLLSYPSQSNDPKRDEYDEVVCGILVYGNTNAITIDHNEIQNVKAIHLDRGSLVARGIYVTTSQMAKEKVGRHISITNNHIHDIGPADDGDGIYYEDSALNRDEAEDTESKIEGNLFENNAKRAIKIYAKGIQITGNKIVNNYLNNNYYQGSKKGETAPDMYSGISVYAGNNIVRNNILTGAGSYYAGIEIASDRTVNNIEVSNNQITMGTESNHGSKTALRVGHVSNFTIASNVLENGDTGIWTWQNAENGIIKDNKITMPNGGGINLYSYLAGTFQKDIQISDNLISATKYEIQTDNQKNLNITIQTPEPLQPPEATEPSPNASPAATDSTTVTP